MAADKEAQAFRQGRKPVIFEDVDVALMIEGEIEAGPRRHQRSAGSAIRIAANEAS